MDLALEPRAEAHQAPGLTHLRSSNLGFRQQTGTQWASIRASTVSFLTRPAAMALVASGRAMWAGMPASASTSASQLRRRSPVTVDLGQLKGDTGPYPVNGPPGNRRAQDTARGYPPDSATTAFVFRAPARRRTKS